jgi:hypothetical protein
MWIDHFREGGVVKNSYVFANGTTSTFAMKNKKGGFLKPFLEQAEKEGVSEIQICDIIFVYLQHSLDFQIVCCGPYITTFFF